MVREKVCEYINNEVEEQTELEVQRMLKEFETKLREKKAKIVVAVSAKLMQDFSSMKEEIVFKIPFNTLN